MESSGMTQLEGITLLVAVIRGTPSEGADMTESYSSGDRDTVSGAASPLSHLQDSDAGACCQPREQDTSRMMFTESHNKGNARRVMDDNAAAFCAQIHTQLATLQGRIDSLKRNVGTTCYLLQERLHELRRKNEATEQAVLEARGSMDVWSSRSRFEARADVDLWIQNHESVLLDERAKMAHDCAVLALVLAENSIDDAERMILEAVAMRQDAEAGCAG